MKFNKLKIIPFYSCCIMTSITMQSQDNVSNEVSSGFSPLLLGAKIGVSHENGIFPEIGVLGHLYFPVTASSDYKPETTSFDFRFAFSHTLGEKANLSYNLGAEWGNDYPEASYIYTLAYGQSITDQFGAYVEIYGSLPENSSAAHMWDAGLTYLVSNNLQFDATVGTVQV